MQNPYQLTQLAYDAGFRANRTELIEAVASAIGESGGNEKARGDNGDSWGLWQISLPFHPEYRSNPEQLYDPQTNAAAAYKIYVAAGRNFEPFHAWSHASAPKKVFLSAAALTGVSTWEVAHPGAALGTIVKPATEAGGRAAGGVVDKVAPGVRDVMGIAQNVGNWLTTEKNIGRLALGIIGAVIIVVGLAVLARPILEPAAKAVADVVV